MFLRRTAVIWRTAPLFAGRLSAAVSEARVGSRSAPVVDSESADIRRRRAVAWFSRRRSRRRLAVVVALSAVLPADRLDLRAVAAPRSTTATTRRRDRNPRHEPIAVRRRAVDGR